MRADSWQSLYQLYPLMYRIDSISKGLESLVQELALVSQLLHTYGKTMNLPNPEQETSWINHQEELV